MLKRILLALSLPAAPLCACAQSPAPPRVVGYYFAPTVQNGFPVSAIKAEFLTHVNYAFANIGADGRAVLGQPCLDIGRCVGEKNPNPQPGGNFAELRRLKARHPHLRTLIAIGGWSWSARFSDVAATPEARRDFVESVITTFFRNHAGVFDGVDLDWEYPVRGGLDGNRHRPQDRENYTLLVREFRRALDELGRAAARPYLLTIAGPAGLEHIGNLDVAALARSLDFINVMTYDYHTGGAIAHFNAPLDAAAGDPTPRSHVRATVAAYRAAGLPAQKLVVGVPFFGHGYADVRSAGKGLFQPLKTGVSTKSGTSNPWIGAIRYHRIADALRAGFTRYWEPRAGVPWLYDQSTSTWITYDDAQSLGLKSDFVRTQGLGGIMIWELSGDDGTLLPAIHRTLNRH